MYFFNKSAFVLLGACFAILGYMALLQHLYTAKSSNVVFSKKENKFSGKSFLFYSSSSDHPKFLSCFDKVLNSFDLNTQYLSHIKII